MRVAHLDTGREWRGGQTQLRHLVRGTSDVVFLHPDAPLRPALESDGVEVIPVAMRGPLVGNRQLRRLIASLRPDLIACHTSQAQAQALLTGAGRPILVHRRNDFVPGLLSRPKYQAVTGFVAVSRAVAGVLEHSGVDPSRIEVVLDGVDVDEIVLTAPDPVGVRRELGLGPDARLVVAVGALVDHKGHRYLVDAMQQLPTWHLAILGEGELHGALVRQARQRGVAERVHLLGWRSDVPRWLKSADVFAHPSVEEGLGSVVAEALVAEVPVVASEAGGLPEVVGEDGTLVSPRSASALGRGILTAHRRGPVDGSATVARCSMVRMAHDTRGAYERLLA